MGPPTEEGPGCGPIWVPRSEGEREVRRGRAQKAGPKPTADRKGADWVAPNLE